MSDERGRLDPKDLRQVRARVRGPGQPAASQRDLARLLACDHAHVTRLEHGHRQLRGLIAAVYLALYLALARGADLSKALDRKTPLGEALAIIFGAAYPEEKK